MTNTETPEEEGGVEWNVWVVGEDTPTPYSRISNLPTNDPSSALSFVALLCENNNGDDNYYDDN